MGTTTISPLRQRMIEDMAARKLSPGTQKGHIRSFRRFAAFLHRSPLDSQTKCNTGMFRSCDGQALWTARF